MGRADGVGGRLARALGVRPALRVAGEGEGLGEGSADAAAARLRDTVAVLAAEAVATRDRVALRDIRRDGVLVGRVPLGDTVPVREGSRGMTLARSLSSATRGEARASQQSSSRSITRKAARF